MEAAPPALFIQPPVVHFRPEAQTCGCGAPLKAQKTRQKLVLSLLGPFVAHETLCACPACGCIFASEALTRLVASGSRVAYDVLVFVGRALFQRHRSAVEVLQELDARGVGISPSEVAYLGRKFIMLLSFAHRQARPRLRREMRNNGGYILHLDAMHEGDAPVLMTGLDGLSEIVLANVKLASEHADHIEPFLRQQRRDYGIPAGCVHDMGTGITKALEVVFPGVPDFVCHFHFLRDIGKDFLEPDYHALRQRLSKHAASSRLCAFARDARRRLLETNSDLLTLAKAIGGITVPTVTTMVPLASAYALSLWALQGKHAGDGYGFPFDRPLLEFAERLLELDTRLPECKDVHLGDDWRENQPLYKLVREVAAVTSDPELRRAVKALRWRTGVFDRLRDAMRIAEKGGRNGLNDGDTDTDIATIRQRVEHFRVELDTDPRLTNDPRGRKMAEQIDKYGDKLFADPIAVKTPKGMITIQPQRTNNVMEQLFRELRRDHRRTTGNDSMAQKLQSMLADTPLVKNLANPRYMEIILDGKANLDELFASQEKLSHGKTTEPDGTADRILPGFRSLIAMAALPKQVAQLFTVGAANAKSN